MKPLVALLAAMKLSSFTRAQTFNFDNVPVGAPPPGWAATTSGSGTPPWTVVADANAPSQPHVLQQSGEATYPVCLKEDTNLQDGFVEV